MAPPQPYQPAYLQPVPQEEQQWPIPKLHLRVNDVLSPGSGTFFDCVEIGSLFKQSVIQVLSHLYTPTTAPTNVRSITLILKDMQGVAYTQGSELDDDHKEIHFSTGYIQSSASRAHDEIFGVLVHEIVHCFQYNARGTCPGGLIEGIADWVRLKAGLAPPHWIRGGAEWDQGYEVTGFFLDWIERKYGDPGDNKQPTFVPKLNETLRDVDYKEEVFHSLVGKSVQDLWEEYKSELEDEQGEDGEKDGQNPDLVDGAEPRDGVPKT